ncbi:hypothetical protein QTP88_009715 [Uroleucon formosanum]
MKVKDIERMMNTAVNKTTPYEALHGYLPRFRSGALSSMSHTRNVSTSPENVQAEVRDNPNMTVSSMLPGTVRKYVCYDIFIIYGNTVTRPIGPTTADVNFQLCVVLFSP